MSLEVEAVLILLLPYAALPDDGSSLPAQGAP